MAIASRERASAQPRAQFPAGRFGAGADLGRPVPGPALAAADCGPGRIAPSRSGQKGPSR
jgi:hypothetical protein